MARGEEVVALDDVGAELGGPPDRDRLHRCPAGEPVAVAVGLEPRLDVVEAGPKRSDAHMLERGLEGRVLAVSGERAAERLNCCGHDAPSVGWSGEKRVKDVVRAAV